MSRIAPRFAQARLAPVFAVLLALAACEENLDVATPDGALHRLRNAVMKKDAPAILDSCSAQTTTLLKELFGIVSAQANVINTTYPEAHRVAARASYPPGMLEAKSPEALFGALLENGLKELNASPGLGFGMTAQGKPSVDGERASVTSQAGEAHEFVHENGVWKTTVFEREVSAAINHARLHQQTLDENLKVVAELARLDQIKQARDAEAAAAGSTPPPK
jgi:hypothetical protein